MDYKNLLREIATYENAGLFTALDILPDPDIILKKRGDDVQVLDDIASDEQVTQCMVNRKYRVLLNERYAFKPGVVGEEKPTEQAQRVCDMFVSDLEDAAVMYDLFASLLDAPFYGFSVAEIIWTVKDGYYRIEKLIPRPHEWFAFNDKGELIFKGEHSLGERVPTGKFIISRHFPTFKNPYGLRLLSRCLWPVAFKKGGVRFFAQFLEKFGTPWVIATAPSGSKPEEKRAMANDLARMVQDAVGVIPYGSTVQLHAAAGAQGDMFDSYINRWDKSISKVLMGQTLTSDIGDNGSFAASKTHKDVGDDMAAADRLMITSAMNELAWLYTRVNFPDVAAPTFAYIDDEDLTARAELDKKLYEMGTSFNAEYIEQIYGIDKKYFSIRDPQPLMPSFAAAEDSDLREAEKRQVELDNAAASAAQRIAEKANVSIAKLKQAVENAADLDDLESALADLGLDFSDAQEIIKNVLTNGAAYGFCSSVREPSAGSPSRAPLPREELTPTKRGSSAFGKE